MMASSKIMLTKLFWLILESLLKSKDKLYQVSSDLGEVNSFYSSFSDAANPANTANPSKNPAWYRVK